MATKPRGSLVALIDSAAIPPETLHSCLRESEIQSAAAILNRRRRDEWIAGRVAAKYAFLSGTLGPYPEQSGGLCFRELSSSDLADFPREIYRSVAVVRSTRPGGGPPRVGWNGGNESVPVAISHSAGIACASVIGADLASLDLEIPVPRVQEFYLRTFTPRERDWISSCVRPWDFSAEWLYTLLWSARECLLKTPQFAALSIANMPALEIEIAEGTERLARVNTSSSLCGFEFLKAVTTYGSFRLAIAGNRKLVVTAVAGINDNLLMSKANTVRSAGRTEMKQDSVAAPPPAAPVNVYGGTYE